MIILGILTPVKLIVFGAIYIFLTIYSLYLVLKNEINITQVLWVLMILLIPYICSILYVWKYLLERRNNKS